MEGRGTEVTPLTPHQQARAVDTKNTDGQHSDDEVQVHATAKTKDLSTPAIPRVDQYCKCSKAELLTRNVLPWGVEAPEKYEFRLSVVHS